MPERKFETQKSKKSKIEIQKLSKAFGGTMTDQECMDALGLSRNTYYKYKKELAEQLRQAKMTT